MKKLFLATTLLATVALAAFLSTNSVSAQRTSTVWSKSGDGGVTVYPYVRVDQKAFFFDFESANFSDVASVDFNLNYDTDGEGTIRGTRGSFDPYVEAPTGVYQGKQYYRRELTLGTCSNNHCTYDQNPRNVTLEVVTKLKSGKVREYTQVVSIPNDQL